MNPLRLLQEMILAAKAGGDDATAEWLASAAHDPATLAEVTGTGRTESESPGAHRTRVLLEAGFTGTVTDSAGRKRHYVNGKQVANPPAKVGNGKAKGKPGGGAGARTPGTAPANPALDAAVTAADPALARKPGAMGKIRDAALRAVDWVNTRFAANYDHIVKAGNLLAEVVDLPSDMKKFGYNPSTTGATSTASHGHDPAKAIGLPVSGHVVATIAAHTITTAVAYAKKKLARRKPEAEGGDATGIAAEVLAGVFAALHEHLGLGDAPDAAWFERLLRARGEG